MSFNFFSSSREKTLQQITEELYDRLRFLRLHCSIREPNPDWYNSHDYSSGQFRGEQKSIMDEIVFLEKLLDMIERS